MVKKSKRDGRRQKQGERLFQKERKNESRSTVADVKNKNKKKKRTNNKDKKKKKNEWGGKKHKNWKKKTRRKNLASCQNSLSSPNFLLFFFFLAINQSPPSLLARFRPLSSPFFSFLFASRYVVIRVLPIEAIDSIGEWAHR